MLSDEQIDTAKARRTAAESHHEHNDCIRIVYEWLDAQETVARPTHTGFQLKHIIEAWAGRYVSQDDVEVAASMHPRIKGRYPDFNLSKQAIRPNPRRLRGITEAGKHPNYREKQYADVYKARAEN